MNAPYEVLDVGDRVDWLKQRKFGLGASDMYSILGLCSWASPISIWLDKTGRRPADPELGELLPEMGTLLEPLAAKCYVQRTGAELVRPELRIFRSIERPWQFCTLDRALPTSNPVELKFSIYGNEWGPEDSQEIPTKYIVQVHWQMDVLGAQWAHVGAIVGDKFRLYTIQRDDELIATLREAGEQFWQENVLKDVQPEPGPRDGSYLQKLYAEYESGKRLEADEPMEELAARYFAAKEQASAHESAAQAIANALKERIGQAGVEIIDGSRWRARWSDGEKTDWKKIAQTLGADESLIARHTKDHGRKLDIRKRNASA